MADCGAVFGEEAWATLSFSGRFAICARSLVAAPSIGRRSDGDGARAGRFCLVETQRLAWAPRVDCGGRDGAGLARIWRVVLPASSAGSGNNALVCEPTG